jgi:hypothetical protein
MLSDNLHSILVIPAFSAFGGTLAILSWQNTGHFDKN